MLGLKIPREEADGLFDTFDRDLSGTIEYSELSKLCRQRAPLRSKHSTQQLNGDEQERSCAIVYAGAIAAEKAAKQRLARIQRMLLRTSSASALQAQREENRLAVASVRQDIDRRVGRDLTAKLAQVAAAGEDDVIWLAKCFNRSMGDIYRGPSEQRSWYKLFTLMYRQASLNRSHFTGVSLGADSLRVMHACLRWQG